MRHWRSIANRASGAVQPITVFRNLQQVLASSGRHDEAERVIEQAWAEMQGYDKLPPEFADSPLYDVAVNCVGFAYYFATIGGEEQAAEFLRRATLAQQRLRKPIDSLTALEFLASVRLRLGDQVGYREACATLIVPPPRSAFDDSPYIPYDDFNMSRILTCCVGPDAVDDPQFAGKTGRRICRPQFASSALYGSCRAGNSALSRRPL